MDFHTGTCLCNQHPDQETEHSRLPKCLWCFHPGTTHPASTILDPELYEQHRWVWTGFEYKWNHSVCILLGLSSFVHQCIWENHHVMYGRSSFWIIITVWDMLVLKNYLLFIRNSSWTGCPVFYLATLFQSSVHGHFVIFCLGLLWTKLLWIF